MESISPSAKDHDKKSCHDAPPLPSPATGTRQVPVVGAAILRPHLCLVARRASHVSSPGLWEFPGGKVEAGESPRAALARELAEELSITVEVGDFLGRGVVAQETRTIVLDVYCCLWTTGQLDLQDHDAVRWIQTRQIQTLPWAEADVPILGALASRLVRSRLRS